jgi:hypothetical protein
MCSPFSNNPAKGAQSIINFSYGTQSETANTAKDRKAWERENRTDTVIILCR